MRIKSIQLENFKKFNRFKVSCRNKNVLVGPNNSGKSSILDALRIVQDVLRFATRRKPHLETFEGVVCASLNLDTSSIKTSIDHISKDYSDNPAIVRVTLDNSAQLVVVLHPNQPLKAHLKTDWSPARTTTAFRKQFPLTLIVVPTLGPVEEKEQFLTDATISKSENTRTAHRHLRNILLRKTDEEFQQFSGEVASAWEGIEIERPKIVAHDQPLQMFYIEQRIPRELFWSGFGFQVWMQIVLQFMRGTPTSVLVLDEPDIYLHPDLQRRLMQVANNKFGQVFIATHATEIINEASPGDILLVSNDRTSAKRITNEEGYRELFQYLGSSENAEFARISRAKRIIFFEGKDKRILRKFANKSGRAETLDDTDTVYLQAGGFSQWRRVKEVNWTLDSLFGMDVSIGALFDRDFRCDEEIEAFVKGMKADGIGCFVLNRKELENYALVLATIIRTLIDRVAKRGASLSKEEAVAIIDELSDKQKVHVQSQLLAHAMTYNKENNPKMDGSTVNAGILETFDDRWNELETRLEVISGKDFISQLSAYMSEKFKTSITLNQLIDEMNKSEVPEDLVEILSSLNAFVEPKA